MSDPVVHPLKHPLKTILRGPDSEREEITSELTMRRLKGKDLRGTDGLGEAGQMLHLIARSAGLTPMQVDEIDLEDVVALGEVVEGFLPLGAKIGKTPSAT